ncbi:Transposase, Mutator family [Priestia megaterium]|nr:Transposase, Mutator family [Priestia megaterium]
MAPYKRANDTLEAFVIHMFQKGVTTAKIAHLMERMYDHHYTPQTILNMIKVMSEQVEALHDRTLCAHYECVYLDVMYIAVKRDTVPKEVFGYTIAPNESVFVWKGLLEDIKSRGVEEILDGLKGISDSVFTIYPDAHYQTCCVHLSRTIAHKVRVSDRAEICEDFKTVYRVESLEMGQQDLRSLIEKGKSTYHKVTKPLLNNPYLFTFCSFPKST